MFSLFREVFNYSCYILECRLSKLFSMCSLIIMSFNESVCMYSVHVQFWERIYLQNDFCLLLEQDWPGERIQIRQNMYWRTHRESPCFQFWVQCTSRLARRCNSSFFSFCPCLAALTSSTRLRRTRARPHSPSGGLSSRRGEIRPGTALIFLFTLHQACNGLLPHSSSPK